MNDLIIKGTGNSRYLKSNISPDTTLQELIEMLNAGTFPFDFNGMNPAGIAEMGTPLNTATLLTDDLAIKLGLDPETATVKKAIETRTLLTGSGAPSTSTEGKAGQLYVDTTAQQLYICIDASEGVYTWLIIASGVKFTVATKTEIITESTTWTAPSSLTGGATQVSVRLFGGGGGGHSTHAGGGGEMAVGTFSLAAGIEVPITIGAGGAKGGGNGGTTSFGTYLSANGGTGENGNGGSGGGGWAFQGGTATYGGGGGAGFNTLTSGGYQGGDGGTYGGGGGGSKGLRPGTGGAGGTYGGVGGNAGTPPTAATAGTNTVGMDLDFTGTGAAGTATGDGGAGGGGYGGIGGDSSNYSGGGGGGYGGNGGSTTGSKAGGGGGGGGYGGNGGAGDSNSAGGGGGYGLAGNGGDSSTPNGGIAAGGAGGKKTGAGGHGICLISYSVLEVTVEG